MTPDPSLVRTVVPGARLDDDVVATVRGIATAAQEQDGVEALGEQTMLDLTDPSAEVVHLLAEGPGGVVGYAQVAAGGSGAELVVAPGARRRGVGAGLLAGVRAVGREAGVPAAVWAHGNLPAARALAAAAGLHPVRELLQLGRDLSPATGERTDPPGPPVPASPGGLAVRPFVVGADEPAWLALNARAFSWHPEQGRMTLRDLHARLAEPWFDPGDLLLAERDGALVASLWMKVEPGSATGELYVLAVDPDAQGQGLGSLLTAVTLHHLAGRGCDRVVLYTEASNEAAVRTYHRAGFEVSRSDVQYG